MKKFPLNSYHKRRLYCLLLFALGISLAASLIFYALRQNMNVFVTPSQLIAMPQASSDNYRARLGGMVKPNSVARDQTGLGVTFIVTDFTHEIKVRYVGILPDLFREGKGVIAEGRMNAQQELMATQVLAKHDENYMPTFRGNPSKKT